MSLTNIAKKFIDLMIQIIFVLVGITTVVAVISDILNKATRIVLLLDIFLIFFVIILGLAIYEFEKMKSAKLSKVNADEKES